VAAQSLEIQVQANYAKARIQLDKVQGLVLQQVSSSVFDTWLARYRGRLEDVAKNAGRK